MIVTDLLTKLAAHEGGLPPSLQLAPAGPPRVGLVNEARANILPKTRRNVERYWLFPRAPLMEERLQKGMEKGDENANYNAVE